MMPWTRAAVRSWVEPGNAAEAQINLSCGSVMN